MQSELKRWRAVAIRAGWRITYQGGHEMWWPPDRHINPVSVTTTRVANPRTLKNHRADLRRAGLEV